MAWEALTASESSAGFRPWTDLTLFIGLGFIHSIQFSPISYFLSFLWSCRLPIPIVFILIPIVPVIRPFLPPSNRCSLTHFPVSLAPV